MIVLLVEAKNKSSTNFNDPSFFFPHFSRFFLSTHILLMFLFRSGSFRGKVGTLTGQFSFLGLLRPASESRRISGE